MLDWTKQVVQPSGKAYTFCAFRFNIKNCHSIYLIFHPKCSVCWNGRRTDKVTKIILLYMSNLLDTVQEFSPEKKVYIYSCVNQIWRSSNYSSNPSKVIQLYQKSTSLGAVKFYFIFNYMQVFFYEFFNTRLFGLLQENRSHSGKEGFFFYCPNACMSVLKPLNSFIRGGEKNQFV